MWAGGCGGRAASPACQNRSSRLAPHQRELYPMRRLARGRVAIDAAIGLLALAAVVVPLSVAGPADAAAARRSAASPGGRTVYVTNSANVGGAAKGVAVTPDGRPAGFDPVSERSRTMVTAHSVSAASAIRTPQFWLLWTVMFCNVTAGIGILEQAGPMISDFFRSGASASVSATEAAGFVGLLSMFNMAGRFVWSSTSDFIGRQPTYVGYLGVGMAAYVLLALFGDASTAFFIALAALIISFYGGGFATVPAYLRDLFGTYQVGAIHGRLLTAWSAAGIAGPLIVNRFLDARGEPGALVAADYRPALFTMVGVLAIGFAANLFIRPVAERHRTSAAESPVSDPSPAT
ncbi:OFA family MFS transporter [Actinomadura soli]|uniref:OFA family MFS transporter n=1 Tax=Actinomadura soli TaxID=2508997 RepID=A0A5C4J1A0_9ACTN|nr:OFA family MFS transporter [Actinomadura soli]